jgi:death-on-curing protein
MRRYWLPSRVYPTVAETIETHRLLIEEFGGLHGIRDRGLPESAVLRPQNGDYGSLIEEGAALMESLANNHAFLDGNKRVSFVMMSL